MDVKCYFCCSTIKNNGRTMSNINFKIDNGVGIIILNRPDKFNSFVRQMAFDLQAALDECKKNPEVRAIYITAEGKAFCAGQDLAEAIDPKQTELPKIVEEHYNPIIERLSKNEKPIDCGLISEVRRVG